MLEALIGKLSNPHLVFPYLYEPVSQQLIILTMFIGIVVAGVALLGGITYFRKWVTYGMSGSLLLTIRK